MKCKKLLYIVLIAVIISLVFLTPFSVCYAQFYDNTYPVDIGFESGYYLRCTSNLSSKTTFFFTKDTVDKLALRSNKQLTNISGSAIYCLCYLNGVQYACNFASGGTARLNRYNDVQNVAVTILDVIDTNIDFEMINPDNPLANNNFYFSKFEISVLTVLIVQLFFIIMGWYLLHRKV